MYFNFESFVTEVCNSQQQSIYVQGQSMCYALTNRGLQSFSYQLVAQNLVAPTALVRVNLTAIVNFSAANLQQEIETRLRTIHR